MDQVASAEKEKALRLVDQSSFPRVKRFNFIQQLADTSPASLIAMCLMDYELYNSKLFSRLEKSAIQFCIAVQFHREVWSGHSDYMVHLHSCKAKEAGLSDHDITSLKQGGLPEDKKLQDLIKATKIVMTKKGNPNEIEKDSMKKWGITEAQLFEISTHIGLGFAQGLIANLSRMEVDEELKRLNI